jgi:hypothetical protein
MQKEVNIMGKIIAFGIGFLTGAGVVLIHYSEEEKINENYKDWDAEEDDDAAPEEVVENN